MEGLFAKCAPLSGKIKLTFGEVLHKQLFFIHKIPIEIESFKNKAAVLCNANFVCIRRLSNFQAG